MPDLETLYQAHPDGDLLIYGIHPGDPPDAVAEFVEQTGITFPVLQDMGTKNAFSYPPGSQYPYPRDVIIDKSGTIRSIKNSFDVVETTALIEALLAEP